MLEAVRKDFPLLQRRIDDKPVCYLDSAATSLKPQSVLDAEGAYSRQYTANVHRGKHALSEEASNAFEGARRRVARFLETEPSCVVFVPNTTAAINLVASGLGLTPEDGVVLGVGEHHSNMVPWMRRGRAEVIDWDPLAPVSVEKVAEELERRRPKVLAMGHASNVSGVVQPIAEVCRVARRLGVITLVDAAQSAPHLKLDVEQLGCDFLAFSGHKMLGPTGIGALWGRREMLDRLSPLTVGGGTVDRVTSQGFTLKQVPYRLEAGTPNIAGAIGLAAAIDYLDGLGMDRVIAHDRMLADALAESLRDLPGARVLMARGKERLAIASVAPISEKISPDHLAVVLSDSHQIMVRSGYHCTHPLFDSLGLAYGSVRLSGYLYNTVDEIKRAGQALRELLERLIGRA